MAGHGGHPGNPLAATLVATPPRVNMQRQPVRAQSPLKAQPAGIRAFSQVLESPQRVGGGGTPSLAPRVVPVSEVVLTPQAHGGSQTARPAPKPQTPEASNGRGTYSLDPSLAQASLVESIVDKKLSEAMTTLTKLLSRSFEARLSQVMEEQAKALQETLLDASVRKAHVEQLDDKPAISRQHSACIKDTELQATLAELQRKLGEWQPVRLSEEAEALMWPLQAEVRELKQQLAALEQPAAAKSYVADPSVFEQLAILKADQLELKEQQRELQHAVLCVSMDVATGCEPKALAPAEAEGTLDAHAVRSAISELGSELLAEAQQRLQDRMRFDVSLQRVENTLRALHDKVNPLLSQPRPAPEQSGLSGGAPRSPAAASKATPLTLPVASRTPKTVIFLDVDGVLHSLYGEDLFRESCCTQLERIVRETSAKIVLSSTWRTEAGKLAMLNGLFQQRNMPAVHDATRDMQESREMEISEWLDRHPGVTRWVALDDLDLQVAGTIHARRMVGHFVQTKPDSGLTSQDADAAILILNGQAIPASPNVPGVTRRSPIRAGQRTSSPLRASSPRLVSPKSSPHHAQLQSAPIPVSPSFAHGSSGMVAAPNAPTTATGLAAQMVPQSSR